MTLRQYYEDWQPQAQAAEAAVYNRPRLVPLPPGVLPDEPIPAPATAESTVESTEKPVETVVDDKRQAMLHNFHNYCRDVAELDPSSENPADEPALAVAIHDFVTSVVHKRAESIDEKIKKNQATSSDRIHIIPSAPVARRISEYYAQFGVNRRESYLESRIAQEDFLAQAKRPVYANLLLHDESDAGGKIPRSVYYPEIGIIMQLREALMEQGARLASDSTEVILASYGQWFQNLAKRADIIIRSDSGQRLIKRPGDFELPTDERPDLPGGFGRQLDR